GFAFNGETSDDVWLIEAAPDGRPLRFTDHIEFGAAQNGVSLGRWPNGSGDLFPMVSPTFGAANSGPLLGDVVLSEVHYGPTPAPAGDPLTTRHREFVEIWNRSQVSVDISHWRLNRGVDFAFPAGTVLPAQRRIVVTAFDPVLNAPQAAAFRQLYGIDDSVILLGPWGGTLDNAGEAVELDRPEELDAVGVGYVLVDRIDYDNSNPWPRLGDTGMSLHRVEPVAYGDFATSWMVAAPSPGSGGGPGRPGDFNGDGVV